MRENRGDMMENHLTSYQSVITEIKSIISSGQEAAYSASSKAMLLTYWNIGKRIVEQEMGGSERAEYGKGLISALAEDLTKEFGKNYSIRNLHYYIKFYQCFPDEQIVNACVHNLNWTHIRSLLRVVDENARYWYMKEAIDENWSSRTLDRNISTQYYQFELIKSPVIAEFLGFKNEDTYLEGDLESAILSHIRDFLMELGRGFAFVARQQHIVTETSDYYLDYSDSLIIPILA